MYVEDAARNLRKINYFAVTFAGLDLNWCRNMSGSLIINETENESIGVYEYLNNFL